VGCGDVEAESAIGPTLPSIEESSDAAWPQEATQMDDHRFDVLLKSLATGISRRTVAKGLAVGAAGGIASLVGVGGVGARNKCKDVGKSCQSDTICCSKFCDNSFTCACRVGGLLSWWRAEGNAADSGPLGNNGSIFGNLSFGGGAVGQAFAFDNASGPSYFQAPTAGLPTGSSDRTLVLWARIDATLVEESLLGGYGENGTYGATYGLFATTAYGPDPIVGFSQWGEAIFGPALPLGQWYHVAASTAGGYTTLYVNGSAVASGSLPMDTPSGTYFYSGTLPGDLGDTRKLQGAVDEVAFYGRALSASEIQFIYASGHCA
jgi:Concanavalin A-like lectin/glucanases superfamily